MTIERPRFMTMPLKEGLDWSRNTRGFHFSEKMDGEWQIMEVENSLFATERMKNGDVYLLDCLQLAGEDIRQRPFYQRLALVLEFRLLNPVFHPLLKLPATGIGGEFLEAVLARGGEGMVAKQLDAPYGATWIKCKRVETYDLLVTEKDYFKGSIRLGTTEGEDRGWCPCKAAFESVAVGQIVEVSAYCITAKGKLREPRFVRIRHDKTGQIN